MKYDLIFFNTTELFEEVLFVSILLCFIILFKLLFEWVLYLHILLYPFTSKNII